MGATRHTVRAKIVDVGPTEARRLSAAIANSIKYDVRAARNGGSYVSDVFPHAMSDGRLRVDAYDRAGVRVAVASIARYADLTGYRIEVHPTATAAKALAGHMPTTPYCRVGGRF